VADWCEHTYANNFATRSGLPPENLVRVLDFQGLFRAPAFTFIQSGLTHAIHHRGQLSTYLRPMGSKVPVVYGETKDSAEAKKSAQAQA